MNIERCWETESGSASFLLSQINLKMPGKGDIDTFSGR